MYLPVLLLLLLRHSSLPRVTSHLMLWTICLTLCLWRYVPVMDSCSLRFVLYIRQKIFLLDKIFPSLATLHCRNIYWNKFSPIAVKVAILSIQSLSRDKKNCRIYVDFVHDRSWQKQQKNFAAAKQSAQKREILNHTVYMY